MVHLILTRIDMKKLLLSLLLVSGCLMAGDIRPKDEIKFALGSYVKHHIIFDNLEWNEGFENSAKGIEYIHYLDKKNGIGLTYLTFRNSYDVRTHAGGIVYKRVYDKILGIIPNTKGYILYQKGYYGTWDNVLGFSDGKTDNKFWTPLASVGFEYPISERIGLTIDVVGHHKYLHAITGGITIHLN